MEHLITAVNGTFDLILLILLLKVFLSWLPNTNWSAEPFATLNKFAELFFAPFRKIIPPLGMIDISPIFAFLTLQVLRIVVLMLLNLIQ
jgi:YggT family protein